MSAQVSNADEVVHVVKQACAAFHPYRLDVRVQARNISEKVITEKELNTFLAELPDVADKCEPIHTSRFGQSESDVDADDED